MSEATCCELIDYLREECLAFAADLDDGHDLLSTFDGHFVAWDEIIDQCKQGLDDVGYSQSPAELIARLINQRDELRQENERLSQQTCDECDPENYGWVFNRVEGRGACTCMIEAEPFQILLKALEQIADPNGPQSGVACAMAAKEALRSVLPLDYSESV